MAYKKVHKLRNKLLWSAFGLIVYLLVGFIPLVGVNKESLANGTEQMTMLEMAISKDAKNLSVLALGFSSYMITSIVVQIVMAILSDKTKNNISASFTKRLTYGITLLICLFQAYSKINGYSYTVSNQYLTLARLINIVLLVTGTLFVVKLGDFLKERGIGGLSIVILINISAGLITTFRTVDNADWKLPAIISAVVILITLYMENHEKRFPLQRISIHNVHSEKNYLAIKYNPVGIMPFMFSSSLFSLVKMILEFIGKYNDKVRIYNAKTSLTTSSGMILYIVILYLLTILLSLLFVSPKDITESFLKSGDCIVNVRAGKPTRRLLLFWVLVLSLSSATVGSLCVGIPMYLQQKGLLDAQLMMLPVQCMMLIGMFCSIFQEIIVYYNYDKYKPFV